MELPIISLSNANPGIHCYPLRGTRYIDENYCFFLNVFIRYRLTLRYPFTAPESIGTWQRTQVFTSFPFLRFIIFSLGFET